MTNAPATQSEAAQNAAFTQVRYAQCWEDADILLAGLNIQPGDTCLSIASAGDNALAMVSQGPAKVIALDLSHAQLACLALRVAAYKTLSHAELLCLIGTGDDPPVGERQALYQRCRDLLSEGERRFWDAHPQWIAQGIGRIGKFERYFRVFRRRVMPLIHREDTIDRLLQGGPLAEREAFYRDTWNSWRWRLLFKLFFSRRVMGQLGRDPAFFKYVDTPVSQSIFKRTEYALTQLNPAENPYLQWILKERFTTALPYALRLENFDAIRNHIAAIEWHAVAIEDYLDAHNTRQIDRYNLSDIFEYMSEENYQRLLERLVRSGKSGGRLAYWNMLAPRARPASMAHQLIALDDLSRDLFRQDKAFFYSRFVVEEIT
jgi:S-adenosylmethionine-diacylglycerol 3-amino-3-carboxypropyl transferase